MLVKDFMIRNVITVSPESSVKEVVKTFVEKKIGGVPIVDEEGKLRGIVTNGDILRAIKPLDRIVQNYLSFSIYFEEENMVSRLSDVANKPIIKIAKVRDLVTVSPDDDMKKVVVLFAKHHFKKLPVVNQAGRVVGVISRGDVIRNIKLTILNEMT